MNARERVKFKIHNVKVIHVETIDLSHGFHFIDVADGPDHVVFVTGKEIFDRLATETGGAASNDY